MKHHRYLKDFEFVQDPVTFNKFSPRDQLKYCLGATLYMPGTLQIQEKILDSALDVTSIVMDFEDAVDESKVGQAEDSVLAQLQGIASAVEAGRITYDDIPLIFLRARNVDQFAAFAGKLNKKQADVLTGFTFPKFSTENGDDYFGQLIGLNQKLDVNLYGMPILEGKTFAYRELRIDELVRVKTLMAPYRDTILNVRVGGTDMSALFGVRRGMNYSIYDILPVRDALSDILNAFSREEDGYVISGPVWEYFLLDKNEDFNNFLHDDIHHSLLTRKPIINDALDGLLREVVLDKANGFTGKTIIHPSHARYVNAMQAVVKEEYDDAMQILGTSGGVKKSAKSNKMNEINPHRYWARKVEKRARAYGVIKDETYYLRMMQ